MRTETVRRALMHARTLEHRRRIEMSEVLVRDAEALGLSWAVSLSGGKDSTVVLDIVRRIAPDTPAVYCDGELELPETIAYIETIPDLVWVQRGTVDWPCWTGLTDRPRPPQMIDPPGHGSWRVRAARHIGVDGYYVGLRKAESGDRRLSLNRWGAAARVAQFDDLWRCNPLAAWQTIDVWAYLLGRGVPYNAAYDRMDDLGIPLDRQRIGPPLDMRSVTVGSLEALRVGWPELVARWSTLMSAASRH